MRSARPPPRRQRDPGRRPRARPRGTSASSIAWGPPFLCCRASPRLRSGNDATVVPDRCGATRGGFGRKKGRISRAGLDESDGRRRALPLDAVHISQLSPGVLQFSSPLRYNPAHLGCRRPGASSANSCQDYRRLCPCRSRSCWRDDHVIVRQGLRVFLEQAGRRPWRRWSTPSSRRPGAPCT